MAFGVVTWIFLVVAVGLTGFWIWTLIDAINTPDESFESGSTLVWVLVIVLLGWLGAFIYLFAGRPTHGPSVTASRMR